MSCPASPCPRGDVLLNGCSVGPVNASKHLKNEAAHWRHPALWMAACQSLTAVCLWAGQLDHQCGVLLFLSGPAAALTCSSCCSAPASLWKMACMAPQTLSRSDDSLWYWFPYLGVVSQVFGPRGVRMEMIHSGVQTMCSGEVKLGLKTLSLVCPMGSGFWASMEYFRNQTVNSYIEAWSTRYYLAGKPSPLNALEFPISQNISCWCVHSLFVVCVSDMAGGPVDPREILKGVEALLGKDGELRSLEGVPKVFRWGSERRPNSFLCPVPPLTSWLHRVICSYSFCFNAAWWKLLPRWSVDVCIWASCCRPNPTMFWIGRPSTSNFVCCKSNNSYEHKDGYKYDNILFNWKNCTLNWYYRLTWGLPHNSMTLK